MRLHSILHVVPPLRSFRGAPGIAVQAEVIDADGIDAAYERIPAGDVS
jgi:hypothetical protein